MRHCHGHRDERVAARELVLTTDVVTDLCGAAVDASRRLERRPGGSGRGAPTSDENEQRSDTGARAALATTQMRAPFSGTVTTLKANLGEMVQPGTTYTATSSHYTLLSTIEAGLGLGDLGAEDASTAPATGIWK